MLDHVRGTHAVTLYSFVSVCTRSRSLLPALRTRSLCTEASGDVRSLSRSFVGPLVRHDSRVPLFAVAPYPYRLSSASRQQPGRIALTTENPRDAEAEHIGRGLLTSSDHSTCGITYSRLLRQRSRSSSQLPRVVGAGTQCSCIALRPLLLSYIATQHRRHIVTMCYREQPRLSYEERSE
jgi:hypothetical protein